MLLKARRMAQRSRTVTACLPCKIRRTKCNDFRPCNRCRSLDPDACVDQTLVKADASYGSGVQSSRSAASSALTVDSTSRFFTGDHGGLNMQLTPDATSRTAQASGAANMTTFFFGDDPSNRSGCGGRARFGSPSQSLQARSADYPLIKLYLVHQQK